jgi:hypothetical protein
VPFHSKTGLNTVWSKQSTQSHLCSNQFKLQKRQKVRIARLEPKTSGLVCRKIASINHFAKEDMAKWSFWWLNYNRSWISLESEFISRAQDSADTYPDVMSQKCLETRPNYSTAGAKTKSSIEYLEPSTSHAHGNNPESCHFSQLLILEIRPLS